MVRKIFDHILDREMSTASPCQQKLLMSSSRVLLEKWKRLVDQSIQASERSRLSQMAKSSK